jgi:glyoxylase I family protein
MPIDVRGLCPLLQVFDMPTSITFYRDVLGFEVIEQSEAGDRFDWALLKLNEAELMLNTAYDMKERPEEPDPTRVAAHEDTGLFFNCGDVDDTYHYLLLCGYDVDPPFVQGYGMKQLYVRDPDGYCVCFQQIARK